MLEKKGDHKTNFPYNRITKEQLDAPIIIQEYECQSTLNQTKKHISL